MNSDQTREALHEVADAVLAEHRLTAALQKAAAITPRHPLVTAGLAWIDGLQQLAAGSLDLTPSDTSVPAAPEEELLATLTAIHDEIFASLDADQLLDAPDVHSRLRLEASARVTSSRHVTR